MNEFDGSQLKKLYIPAPDSHKGQNGKVLVIAGSKLFHAAALWALEAASHLVDMVYFSSVEENNEIVTQAKKEFRNGIVIPRSKIEWYIQEADAILIGPGLPRPEGQEQGDDNTKELTEGLLKKYPNKKWVIDGGSLQVIDSRVIPSGAILTPHVREFDMLFPDSHITEQTDSSRIHTIVHEKSTTHNCTILLKGPTDIVCSSDRCVSVSGGNAGMTKGGTGDVLAGIAAGLYAKNDAFLSAAGASYFNKRASERLFETKGLWYSTSEIVHLLPHIMNDHLLR